MFNIRNSIKALLTIAAIALSHSAFAQELTPQTQYQGGATVKNSYFGIGLTIPQGMVGAFNDDTGAQALVAGSNTVGLGFMLLFQNGVNTQTYQNLLAQPFPIQETVLEPQTAPSIQGNTVTSQTADFNRGVIGRHVALIGQNGSSVLLIAFAAQDLENELNRTVKTLIGSIKFFKSIIASNDTKAQKTWTNQLSGKTLVRSNTSNSNSGNGFAGTSSETRLTLCRDSSYQYISKSIASVSAAGISDSSSSQDGSQGRWAVEFASANGLVLVLTEPTGLQRRMAVSFRANRLFLNNQPVVVSNSGC
jgi:hypothetical protein